MILHYTIPHHENNIPYVPLQNHDIILEWLFLIWLNLMTQAKHTPYSIIQYAAQLLLSQIFIHVM